MVEARRQSAQCTQANGSPVGWLKLEQVQHLFSELPDTPSPCSMLGRAHRAKGHRNMKVEQPKLGRKGTMLLLIILGAFPPLTMVKWSCFLGQVCGLSKVHLVSVHAAFRVSALTKYAMADVRLSRAV